MKLLAVNAIPFVGGAERWLVHLVRRLAPRGHAIDVACDVRSPLGELVLQAGARRTISRKRWSGVQGALAIARALREGGHDLVLSTSRADLVAAGLGARLAGLPGSVARLNSGWSPFDPVIRSGIKWRRQRFYHRHLVELAATNSAAGKRDLVARDYLPPDRIVPIHNGVDVERFEPDRVARGAFRRELSIPADARLVVSISRFARRKGQTEELEAAGELLRRHADLHFAFLGPTAPRDEEYNQELRARAARLPGAARIHFQGERGDVPEVLADADLLLRAALTEGLPNCALEAMAMRVPVVATDICGTPEAVLDGVTGRLIAPADPAAIVAGVESLLSLSASERTEMGRRGREHVLAHFTLARMAEQYERLFERALAARGGDPARAPARAGR